MVVNEVLVVAAFFHDGKLWSNKIISPIFTDSWVTVPLLLTLGGSKGFFVVAVFVNDGRLQTRIFNGVGKLYVSLQLYCWAIL